MLSQRIAGTGHLGADDGQLALALRVVQPVVQAAALHSVVQVTRAVAGEDGDGRHSRLHGADLGNADLVLTQVFEQEGLKRFVGAVYLVNEQHRPRCRRAQGLQKRTGNEVAVLVHLPLRRAHVGSAALGFSGTQVQQLRSVVPFVQRLALLHAVVALQANQHPLQRTGQCLRQGRLAHAGLPLQQQRPLQLERKKHGGGQPPVWEVALVPQRLHQGIDRGQGIHA